jgi:cell division protein FtsI/penicillin-binding protein 2
VTPRRKNVRIYLIGVLFFVIAGVLWARLAHIQYVRHDDYRAEAQTQKLITDDIQPVRGCIFDRQGRPLALSVRLHSVYLHPAEVKNHQRVTSVVAKELGLSKREVRNKIRSDRKFVWLKRKCNLSEESLEKLKALPGVDCRHEQGRIYPYGELAAKIVGFVGVDNRGMAGVEASFENELRGIPGKAKVLKNGRYQRDRYYRFVEKQPQDGKHVYLTIDATIQEIAEGKLERAVKKNGARSGAIVVVTADTGEILALAEYPSPTSRTDSQRADSLWTIRSVSHVIEPGSTFKLISSAVLLDSRRVAPADTFDAENGAADVGVARIKDPHPHGRISFEDAFAYSSNIVMYKASELIDPKSFHRYVRMFGFGERTGIGLFGESAGTVAPFEKWSLRTKGTMAFGQEIAVTPLQMIGAYTVAANDGVMVLPRIIRGVADGSTGDVDKTKPVKVRRVVRKATARTLMDFCRRAVIDGTGENAAVDFMDVSGKTGTAQKARARGGYVPGKYVSSFIGFAPHDDPRIVCLVLLDEPRYASRYGGVSCAPEFAGLCRDIANATGVFDGVLASSAISPPRDRDDDYRAPNFIRMERAAALEHARKLGCNVLCKGESGRVVSQTPGPGLSMDKDDVIRLVVSDGTGTAIGRGSGGSP